MIQAPCFTIVFAITSVNVTGKFGCIGLVNLKAGSP